MSAGHSMADGVGRPTDRPAREVPAARFRLLHSTGERLIADRGTALATLAVLPGAKLFVLAA